MSDFRFTNHGSICTLTPTSEAGQNWAADHLPPQQDWEPRDGWVVEPRYAGDIFDGITAEGLSVN